MRYLRGALLNASITPTTSAAVGRWKLADQFDAQRLGIWPLLGVTATGGTQTTGNGYNQWSFTSSGTFSVTVGGVVYYAIVAGGAGGGYWTGGGGGSGGVVTGQINVTAGSYSIVVGSGGSAGVSGSGPGGAGGNSSAFGYTAVGGGGGGGNNGSTQTAGLSGGSGGGSSGAPATTGGFGIAGMGWNGGNNTISGANYPAGGGGGAGGVGTTATVSNVGGNGGTGIGVYLPVSASTVYYGGGGGGGVTQTYTVGTGGTGGGGNGGNNGAGANATTNTGGGGGGGGYQGGGYNGGAGGSGIVVIWSPVATPSKTPYVQYLGIAGGGGGGEHIGGGGGAGGVLQGITQVTSGATYTVTIGSGGTGAAGGTDGGTFATSGANSSISGTGVSLTLTGGGRGASTYESSGTSGGSGGGGGGVGPTHSSGTFVPGGAGTTGQGYVGGGNAVNGSPYRGGGGGGYGMAGYNGDGQYNMRAGDGYVPQWLTTASYSNLFNGSNSNLTLASQTGLNCGTSNWTVEAWFNAFASSSNNNSLLISNGNSSWSSGAINIIIGNATPSIGINSANSGGSLITSSTSYTKGIWNHLAVVRNGTTITMYLNGTSVGSATVSSGLTCDFGYSGGTKIGGGSWDGSNSYFNGYISNLRLVNGTAVYTGNFTVSTAPLTAISGTQLLTCQSNGFIDNSSNVYAITANNVPMTSTYNPFGFGATASQSWSIFCPGQCYFTYPTTLFTVSNTTSWTVECWVYLLATNTSGDYIPIIGNLNPTGSGAAYGCWIDNNNKIAFSWYIPTTTRVATGATIPVGQWVHLAYVSNAGVLGLYIDGAASTLSGTTTIDGSPSGSYSICSFQNNNSTKSLNGYASNLRIVNGTALYTSNFTPSTTPLTAITNTTLLAFQSGSLVDNSSNNYTITKYGNPSIASQNPFGYAVAGGGGGGDDASGTNPAGYGGMGGGGYGTWNNAGAANAAIANTGSGGGGGGGTEMAGGNGGSGVVVFAYPSFYAAASSTTGSPSVSTINGMRTYTFTSSGSITI